MISDQEIYETCIGIRQQLRSLLSQVGYVIERMTAQKELDEAQPAEKPRPNTFGSKEEILNGEER